ncbi:MAG: hypothetical protein Q9218_004843 [Villophora microphyllina]
MASSSAIPTAFLILSDTHDIEFDTFTKDVWPAQRKQEPRIDVVLHCGDMTRAGGISSFKKALKMMGSIEAELKLVTAGNHDLELDKHYWSTYRDEYGNAEDPADHDEAVKVMKGSLAAEAGVTFLDEGTCSFTLKSGATLKVYASPYTPAFFDWAFMYGENEDRLNLPDEARSGIKIFGPRPVPDGVDIIMTHGRPRGILDQIPQGNVGCDKLLRAIKRVKPIMHCFGHIHGAYGLEIVEWEKPAENRDADMSTRSPMEVEYSATGERELVRWQGRRGEQTLAVNAAIEKEPGKPPNAPWLVTLDLPRMR